jgi:hypothetical protein
MNPAKVIYSLVLPVVVWLLLGAPSLEFSGNLAVLVVLLLHLGALIWYESLFSMVRGDTLTYGMVTQGLNILLFAVCCVGTGVTLFIADGRIVSPSDVPKFVWGGLILGLLLTISIPLLASRQVRPLPRATDRREFENPTDSL